MISLVEASSFLGFMIPGQVPILIGRIKQQKSLASFNRKRVINGSRVSRKPGESAWDVRQDNHTEKNAVTDEQQAHSQEQRPSQTRQSPTALPPTTQIPWQQVLKTRTFMTGAPAAPENFDTACQTISSARGNPSLFCSYLLSRATCESAVGKT